MNHSVYLILALLLTCIVGPSGTGSDLELQKLFNTIQLHMSKCVEKETDFAFYVCPSHLWPEIVQHFIPMVRSLGDWIGQRIDGDVVIWFQLARYLKADILNYDSRKLVEFKDEVKAWILLNHYLKFDQHQKNVIYKCLRTTLRSLTDVDLGRVSRIPYGGSNDLSDEINELVNDPKKARLLDGLKRASRDDVEMSYALASLRRWLKRDASAEGVLKHAIFRVAFEESTRNIPIEQLHTKTARVPDFKGDQELAKLSANIQHQFL